MLLEWYLLNDNNSYSIMLNDEDPYAIYKNNYGWEWRVLKTYQHPDNEKSNEYARWFVSATSPEMHDGGYEMGDNYSNEILENAYLESSSPEWKEHYKS